MRLLCCGEAASGGKVMERNQRRGVVLWSLAFMILLPVLQWPVLWQVCALATDSIADQTATDKNDKLSSRIILANLCRMIAERFALNDPRRLASLERVARAYGASGDAMEWWQRTKECAERTYGNNDLVVARILEEMCSLPQVKDRFVLEFGYRRERLQLLKCELGDSHAAVARECMQIARLCMDHRRLLLAESYARDALAAQEKVDWDYASNKFKYMFLLAEILSKRGKLSQARELLDKLVTLEKDAGTSEQERLVETLDSAAMLHLQAGEESKALALWQERADLKAKIASKDKDNETQSIADDGCILATACSLEHTFPATAMKIMRRLKHSATEVDERQTATIAQQTAGKKVVQWPADEPASDFFKLMKASYAIASARQNAALDAASEARVADLVRTHEEIYRNLCSDTSVAAESCKVGLAAVYKQAASCYAKLADSYTMSKSGSRYLSKAIELYKKLAELSADEAATAAHVLQYLYCQSGDFSAAARARKSWLDSCKKSIAANSANSNQSGQSIEELKTRIAAYSNAHDWDAAVVACKQLLNKFDTASELAEPDHDEEEIRYRSMLEDAYLNLLNIPDAIGQCDKQLSLIEHCCGKLGDLTFWNNERAKILSTKAYDLFCAGNLRSAVATYKDALDSAERGEYCPGWLDWICTGAATAFSQFGMKNEALACIKKGVSCASYPGGEPAALVEALVVYARICAEWGEVQKAQSLLQEANKAIRRSDDENRELSWLFNIRCTQALIEQSNHNLDAAIGYYRQAVSIGEICNSFGSAELCSVRVRLAELLVERGLLVDAADQVHRALAGFAKLSGNQHYDIGRADLVLSSIEEKHGRFELAATLKRKGIAILQSSLDKRHPILTAGSNISKNKTFAATDGKEEQSGME